MSFSTVRGSACACLSISGHAGRDKVEAVEKVKLTRSSGDVFRDLGFSGDEAEYLQLRAELMVNLQKVITARGLKQASSFFNLVADVPGPPNLERGPLHSHQPTRWRAPVRTSSAPTAVSDWPRHLAGNGSGKPWRLY